MSMISFQRDTLLVMADALEEEYPSFASEVRRAANTIWELRNKLAGTVDQSEEIDKRTAELDFQIADNWRLTAVNEALKEQNAKLREQIHWLKKGDVLHVLTDQEFIDQQRHEREMLASITALDDENARLRSCLSDDAENARQIMGENAKLREERREYQATIDSLVDECADHKAENAKLRELVYDMLEDEERGHNDELTFDEHVERANNLGVEFRG